MLAAALAIPLSGVTLALGGGQAWASKGPNGKMTCTSVTGTASGNITVSGCTDTGSATATASDPLPATQLASGGTVTWTNGKTTTVGAPAITSTSAKHCSGYVKSTKKAPYSGPEPSADKFSGSVTADTSGLKVPGKIKGAVCISSSGSVTDLKPIKIS
jgi:hypothetical protein